MFKIGDKVKVINFGGELEHSLVGTTGVISLTMYGTDVKYPIVVAFDPTTTWREKEEFMDSELELIDNSPLPLPG